MSHRGHAVRQIGTTIESLKGGFADALSSGDLAEASRYLDDVERHGAEAADWVKVKRDLLSDRQERR